MPRPSPQTDRIIRLLQLLADQPDEARSLAEISRFLGVAKPTCYPMLATLTDAGWLVRHPTKKTYRLGPALIPLGSSAADSLDVVALARPLMGELADETAMTCIAALPSGIGLVLGEIIHPSRGGRRDLSVRVGDRFPARPPSGFGLAAWSPEEVLNEWLDRGAEHLGVSRDHLRAQYAPSLETVRRRGFSVECLMATGDADPLTNLRGLGLAGRPGVFGLLDGLTRIEIVDEIEPSSEYQPLSISSPVFGPDGLPVLLLSVTDAVEVIRGDRLIDICGHLKRVTDTLSESLRH
ncbi:MAG TPA: helix-turn-helix domain-containing protein [Microbacterium sp.]|uniref:IclR family transcriptional regulator n=1 Tax=Microbacterium sp. TaxID=51671 RepID=UPI002CFB662C|nr:helix-turn-helix domain-containing protein [Microbacterium sp.]HWI31286.1 helix-turn-helix domain-containing protein [Microbacterium sp.]